MSDKVVIPVSGGMDSAYLLYLAKSMRYEPYPLVFDDSYGNVSLRNKGMGPAINIIRHAGLEKRLEVIPFFPTNYHKIEDGKYGYTPGRNMAIALASLAYADFIDAGSIWLGFTRSNEKFYPDQDHMMFKALADMYNEVYTKNICIELMIQNLDRTEIVERGTELGVPFHETVSCVKTFMPVNCGVCDRCRQRRLAFKHAVVIDKTVYLKDE